VLENCEEFEMVSRKYLFNKNIRQITEKRNRRVMTHVENNPMV
jgi:abortive infection bacteriophage resistance protein